MFNPSVYRERNGLTPYEFTNKVREIAPKFDRPLLSKVEHPEDYGVCLSKDVETYLLHESGETRRKTDGHLLKCRISCRLTDGEFAVLQKAIWDAGFYTINDGLKWLISKGLGVWEKEKNEAL